MSELEELKAEVAKLREEVAALREGQAVHHYHYHTQPLGGWPQVPNAQPQGPWWYSTCQLPSYYSPQGQSYQQGANLQCDAFGQPINRLT